MMHVRTGYDSGGGWRDGCRWRQTDGDEYQRRRAATTRAAAHPDWSPAAVKSAMMTSASVTDNLGREITDETNGNASTGWAVGSGHVKPEKAVNPGLIYDIAADDYVNFLCSSNYSEKDIDTIARQSVDCPKKSTTAPWDLNYPSISVAFKQSGTEKHEATAHRTVTNVGEEAAEYTVSIRNPIGAAMDVQPRKLVFSKKGQKLVFSKKGHDGDEDSGVD